MALLGDDILMSVCGREALRGWRQKVAHMHGCMAAHKEAATDTTSYCAHKCQIHVHTHGREASYHVKAKTSGPVNTGVTDTTDVG